MGRISYKDRAIRAEDKLKDIQMRFKAVSFIIISINSRQLKDRPGAVLDEYFNLCKAISALHKSIG